MGLIVFGSQRGNGSDLATHLMNGEDNEYVERIEGRGSVADDTHGAFAEHEAIAHSMTRCKKYLYSLSINPDPRQARFTHDQYMDYIERAEESLGLMGQPREIYKHIKEDKAGRLREHYHVVWSRIDINEGKAIHMAFDKSKLMNVTRQFALDHNIKLPDGYHTGIAKADQLSLYDKAQVDQTGITKEERMEVITDLWRRSDSASAFVSALEDQGYILANGRRPYVLVDMYGGTNALPRMIDDKSVRAKDVQAFLKNEYPPDSLPSVDEAKALARQFQDENKALKASEKHAQELERLNASQDKRRDALQAQIDAQTQMHKKESEGIFAEQLRQRAALQAAQAQDKFQVQLERTQNNPKGLAGFFSKVSGISFLRTKLQQHEDHRRGRRHELQTKTLMEDQLHARETLTRTHHLKMSELRRAERNQEHVFTRERRSLEKTYSREHALGLRKGHDHMPSVHLTLTPGGRAAAPHKAMRRHSSKTVKEPNVKAKAPPAREEIDLRNDFTLAAKPGGQSKSASGKSPKAEFETRPQDKGRKR